MATQHNTSALSFLWSRYDKYKKATGCLVAWLDRAYGSLQDQKPLVEQGRVPVNKLVEMVEAIAVAGLKVPQKIVNATQEALVCRKNCALFYTECAIRKRTSAQLGGADQLHRSNETHEYFIKVLHHVFGKLIQLPREERCQMSHSSNDDELWKNYYSYLDVVEPQILENYKVQAQVGGTDDPKQDPSTLNESETALEVWCHLADMKEIRDYVCQLWTEYSSGRMSFLAAAQITENSLQLLRLVG